MFRKTLQVVERKHNKGGFRGFLSRDWIEIDQVWMNFYFFASQVKSLIKTKHITKAY